MQRPLRDPVGFADAYRTHSRSMPESCARSASSPASRSENTPTPRRQSGRGKPLSEHGGHRRRVGARHWARGVEALCQAAGRQQQMPVETQSSEQRHVRVDETQHAGHRRAADGFLHDGADGRDLLRQTADQLVRSRPATSSFRDPNSGLRTSTRPRQRLASITHTPDSVIAR